MRRNKTGDSVKQDCLALAVPLLICMSAQAADPNLVEPGRRVAGSSQAEWTRAWWQWAASFDQSRSPVADTTGALCASGQQGPVWFLAGTYGTGRAVRTCTVPAGKYLFFPLINYVMFPRQDDDVSCSALVQGAKDVTDGVSNLVLRVDGRDIEGLGVQRLSSQGCFDLGKRKRPPEIVFPVAADGYYAMLKPLAPGRHTLEFGGVLSSMTQAISYTLDVK